MHGARRSATVTCKTDVELLAVSREDFIDIFMHIEKDREPEHIQFLRTVDVLRGWPIEKLPYDNPRICLFTFFRRGVLLCKDSNTSEWIYIIKTGSCRVLKDLIATKPNIPGLEFIDYSTFPSSISKLPPLQPRTESQQRCRRKSAYLCTDGHRNLYRRLPQLKGVTEENLLATASEHLNEINQIFTKRHRTSAYSKSDEENPTDDKKDVGKVFVQIQKLGPKETFGLEQTTFSMMGQTTGCSLVSEGAECILINKKFFLHHLTDDVAKKIRKTIQPIPTEASLQQKLQDKTNWDAFKTRTITSLMLYKKDLHDYASLYY